MTTTVKGTRPVLAFRAHPRVTKSMLVAEMVKHREADRLARGTYWRDGRGCAVGCSIHSINRMTGARHWAGHHAALAAATGIPGHLIYLADELFERMSPDRALLWPEQFYAAIPDGADLSDVWPVFAAWMLRTIALPAAGSEPRIRAAIERIAAGYESRWKEDLAITAYAAAARYKADAARAAQLAAMAATANSPYCAAYAVRAAGLAARATAGSGRGIRAANRMADKLLELLAAAPTPRATPDVAD